jgi:hypothetical protein
VSHLLDVSSAADLDTERVRPKFTISAVELAADIALLMTVCCLYAPLIIGKALMGCITWARKPGSAGSGPRKSYWNR